MALADDADRWRGVAAAVIRRSARSVRAAIAVAAVMLVVLIFGAALAPAAAQGPAGTVTTADGVYSPGQASRGRDQYRKRCVLCHLDNGQGQAAVPMIPGESLEREGDATAPPIAGDAFLTKWAGRTAWDLFDTMAGTMPVGGARSLTPEEYADLLAYVLSLNKFPAGGRELTPVRAELERIALGK